MTDLEREFAPYARSTRGTWHKVCGYGWGFHDTQCGKSIRAIQTSYDFQLSRKPNHAVCSVCHWSEDD
jgi:hypothetical protein